MDSASTALSSFTQPWWDFDALFKSSDIPHDVQRHLANVYAVLTASIVCCALSCTGLLWLSSSEFVVDHVGWITIISVILVIAGMIWLLMEPEERFVRRFCILMLISAAMGGTIISIVVAALAIDSMILITAFVMTTTVFVCFSASAILSARRSYLYMGGILGSSLSVLVFLGFINYFFKSDIVDSLILYGGLVLFCLYVMFDTQMIIERASLGDKDAIKHSLDLFLDFISIFIRIVMILIKLKEGGNDDNAEPSQA